MFWRGLYLSVLRLFLALSLGLTLGTALCGTVMLRSHFWLDTQPGVIPRGAMEMLGIEPTRQMPFLLYYPFPCTSLLTFRNMPSDTQGHPSYGDITGGIDLIWGMHDIHFSLCTPFLTLLSIQSRTYVILISIIRNDSWNMLCSIGEES